MHFSVLLHWRMTFMFCANWQPLWRNLDQWPWNEELHRTQMQSMWQQYRVFQTHLKSMNNTLCCHLCWIFSELGWGNSINNNLCLEALNTLGLIGPIEQKHYSTPNSIFFFLKKIHHQDKAAWKSPYKLIAFLKALLIISKKIWWTMAEL